jgi:hypothetical protein
MNKRIAQLRPRQQQKPATRRKSPLTQSRIGRSLSAIRHRRGPQDPVFQLLAYIGTSSAGFVVTQQGLWGGLCR